MIPYHISGFDPSCPYGKRAIKVAEMDGAKIYKNTLSSPADDYLIYFRWLEVRSPIFHMFRLHIFPGNCAWLVVSDLHSGYRELDLQLKLAERIARIYHYAGLFLSNNDKYSGACYVIIEKRGYKLVIESKNEHSDNTTGLWFKNLERR